MTIEWIIRVLLGMALIWCSIAYVVLYVRGKPKRAKRKPAKQSRYKHKWLQMPSICQKPKPFEGLAHRPVCALCEAGVHTHAETITTGGQQRERPPQIKQKRGAKHRVDTKNHYCPNPLCRYFGWLGCGNIRSNGHPSGGRWRQLECVWCGKFLCKCKHLPETQGTVLYRNRVPAETVLLAIAALCEGVGIRKVARIYGVHPDEVLGWLVEASRHSEAVSRYLLHDLHVERVKMDELYVLLGGMKQVEEQAEAKQGEKKKRLHSWLWSAIDPESKLLLAVEIGDRTLDMAQRLVHWVAQVLAPRMKYIRGEVPLFETDQLVSYEKAILSHWGEWVEPTKNADRQPEKPRWMPQAQLQYAQVVSDGIHPQERSRKRIVSVRHRVVYGTKEAVRQVLARVGQKINTAFIERLNRTFRAHIPGLNRREEDLAKTELGREAPGTLVLGLLQFLLVASLSARAIAGAGRNQRHGLAEKVGSANSGDGRWAN